MSTVFPGAPNPGGGLIVDPTGDAGVVSSSSASVSGGRPLLLARFFFDSGTQYHSKEEVEHPDYTYEARVLNAGYVDRSIPVPSGLPQLGDCQIRLADTDRHFRDLFATETPRRRLFDLRIVREGDSESAYQVFATFEIVDAEFSAGDCTITGRDINFAWIDKPIPGLINRTNFPDLMEGVDEAFMPIICGVLDAPSDASPPNPQGVLTLPRMTTTRWGLAQHPIIYVELCNKLADEGEFTYVPNSEYSITEEAHTIDGVDYTLSFIDFHADQDPGMELRARIVEGFYTRGEFAGLPERINSPVAALRNPVDALINVIYGTLQVERRIPRFNAASFESVMSEMDAIPYACDFAIDRPKTVREFLAEWTTSFETDIYVNKFGEISLNMTLEEDTARPVFSDGPVFGQSTDNSLIMINSVRQRLANPTCNRLRYNYGFNYSTDEFQYKDIFDNDTDQLSLGGDNSPITPFIEDDTVQLMCVRESDTALAVASRRLAFLSLGSFRIELQLPLPEVMDDVELAKLVGITHYGGLDTDGFQNQEVKITGITHDLDRFITTIRAILRVPQEIGEEAETVEFTGDTYIEAMDLGTIATGANATHSRTLFYLPQSGYDLDNTTFYLEAVYQNDETNDEIVTVYPVLSAGASLTVDTGQTLTLPASTRGRVRSVTEFTPHATTSLYVIETPGGTGTNIQLYRVRVVTAHGNVSKAAAEIYLSNASSATADDQTIGGGDIFRTTNYGAPDNTDGFTSVGGPRWTYEADKWDTITRLHLWVILANASFTPDTRWSEAILYDLTAASYLEASRIIAQDGNMFLNPRPFSVDIPLASLTDGHTYELRIRSVKDGIFGDFNTYFHKSRIHIYLEPLQKFEFYQRCGNSQGVAEERTRYAPIPVAPDADVIFEAHDAVNDLASLSDFGLADTGSVGTVFTGSEVLIEDSTKKFARTQDLSGIITDGNRFAGGGMLQGSIITRYPRIDVQFPYDNDTPRKQYIEYLFNQGYLPSLAVLFEEGTGTPTEFIRSASMSVGGSASWTTDATYGTAGRASATTDYWTIDNVSRQWVPTERATLLIIRKKADTTKRDSNLAGVYNGAGVFFGNWLSMNIPVSGGGGLARWNVGSNDLTVAFTVSTNVETLACKFGPSGRSIWRNGVSIASDTTVVTRGQSDATDDFGINRASSNYSNGDIQDFYFMALIRAAVPDDILSTFTVSNVLVGM